jgi:hypothetical protein
MTGRRSPGDLPLSHIIARISLVGFVALFFLAALALAFFLRGGELALERTIEDAVRSRLLP